MLICHFSPGQKVFLPYRQKLGFYCDGKKPANPDQNKLKVGAFFCTMPGSSDFPCYYVSNTTLVSLYK